MSVGVVRRVTSHRWPLTGQGSGGGDLAVAVAPFCTLIRITDSWRLHYGARDEATALWRYSFGPGKVVRSGARAALTESPLGSMTASLFPAHNCATCNLVCVIIMLLYIYTLHLHCNMYILWNYILKRFNTLHAFTFNIFSWLVSVI